MTCSVVVATYNGEEFIVEQLESIQRQTHPVDEVLIFDDCSSDSTPQLCREFIGKNNLTNWSFSVNVRNVGYNENFFNGFSRTKGDIIFISDQDDVWEENKVEVMLGYFEKNSSVLSLATTFSRYDQNMNLLCRHVNFPHRRKGDIRKILMPEICVFNSYMGMSMAFRREHLNIIPEECRNIAFEQRLNTYAVIQGGLFFLDIALVKRRSYSNSVSNSKTISDIINKYDGNVRLHNAYWRAQNVAKIKSICQQMGAKYQTEASVTQIYEKLSLKRIDYIANNSLWQWLINVRVARNFTISSYLMDGWCILKLKLRNGFLCHNKRNIK